LLTRLFRRASRGSAAPEPANPAELLRRVRAIELRARRLVDALFAGQYVAVFRGRGIDFYELRAYVPGDDTRTIDWKTFARRGEPFVRRYREDRELTVIFAVDVSASMRSGNGRRPKADVAAELCAVLALAAARNGDRVGLLLFAESPERYIRPAAGQRHVLRVVRELLGARPSSRGTDLAAALGHLQRVHRRRATVFLVSDFLGGSFARELRAAADRHDLIAICVRSPLDTDLPAAGIVRLADAETGRVVEVDTRSAAVRAAYAEAVRRADEERALLFGSLGIDEIAVTTEEDYVPALIRFFEQRQARVAS
jgi:uncharacterized protein (DUF58 family)